MSDWTARLTAEYKGATGRGELNSAEIGFIITVANAFASFDKEIELLKEKIKLLEKSSVFRAKNN